MGKTVRRGTRIGRQGRIAVACTATVIDRATGEVLMARREDNGMWSVIGGTIEPGETVTEACEREILEETGIRARIGRLVGVYSNPDILFEYPDGNKIQIVILHFLAESLGGTLRTCEENTDVGWFTREELATMNLQDITRKRLEDSFSDAAEVPIRHEFDV